MTSLPHVLHRRGLDGLLVADPDGEDDRLAVVRRVEQLLEPVAGDGDSRRVARDERGADRAGLARLGDGPAHAVALAHRELLAVELHVLAEDDLAELLAGRDDLDLERAGGALDDERPLGRVDLELLQHPRPGGHLDAALDEHNVIRFVNTLRDFANVSQYIVITHNKKTVTGASTLLGITMQESGVTKAVTIKLENETGTVNLVKDEEVEVFEDEDVPPEENVFIPPHPPKRTAEDKNK